MSSSRVGKGSSPPRWGRAVKPRLQLGRCSRVSVETRLLRARARPARGFDFGPHRQAGARSRGLIRLPPKESRVSGAARHERAALNSSHPYLETPLAKPNYRHAKRQKELARKTKQNEKLQRRSPRTDGVLESDPSPESDQPAHAPSPAVVGERD